MPKLKAPPGTDEANYGDQRFPVADDGTIEVPAEAVDSLVEVGGFTVEPEASAADPEQALKAADPATFATMRHPQGGSCSVDGVSYEADAGGVVRVPQAAVTDLLAHGFEVVEA